MSTYTPADVAREVMGWPVVADLGERERSQSKGVVYLEDGPPQVWRRDENDFWRCFWNPFSNIKDAWEVVEKMRERGFTYRILDFSGEECGHLCSFWLWDDPEWDEQKNTELAPTAPEAICKAALLAVRGGGN